MGIDKGIMRNGRRTPGDPLSQSGLGARWEGVISTNFDRFLSHLATRYWSVVNVVADPGFEC